ncbi:hypothetical protein K438DRAFT_1926575 [Mycena galopus ATCC 62051]|nr:hypothetical protein K438DRAFT_1926575 [Mycena galopus ATCC 62051]
MTSSRVGHLLPALDEDVHGLREERMFSMSRGSWISDWTPMLASSSQTDEYLLVLRYYYLLQHEDRLACTAIGWSHPQPQIAFLSFERVGVRFYEDGDDFDPEGEADEVQIAPSATLENKVNVTIVEGEVDVAEDLRGSSRTALWAQLPKPSAANRIFDSSGFASGLLVPPVN